MSSRAIKTISSLSFLTILLSALLLYQFYIDTASRMLSVHSIWGAARVLLMFSPVLIVMAGIVLFYKQRKAGWIIVAGYFTVLSLGFLFLIFTIFQDGAPRHWSDVMIVAIIMAIFLSFVFGLYFICKRVNRQLYHVGRRAMFITVALALLLTGAALYALWVYEQIGGTDVMC